MQTIDTIQLAKERQMSHQEAVSFYPIRCKLQGEPLLSTPVLATIIMILVLILLSTGCTLASVEAAGDQSANLEGAELENRFSINQDHLSATWRIYDKGYPSFLKLNDDHSFQRSHSARMEQILDFGEWWFDGELLTLSSDEAVTNCNGKTNGQYRLWNKPYDGIFFARIEEDCVGRLGFGWEEDYAPIQLTGKLCRVDSVSFCDSFIGYEAEEVVQPNAQQIKDKVVAPSRVGVEPADSIPQASETAEQAAEKETVVTNDAQSDGDSFFLRD